LVFTITGFSFFPTVIGIRRFYCVFTAIVVGINQMLQKLHVTGMQPRIQINLIQPAAGGGMSGESVDKRGLRKGE
jgi:hypothetical protein